MRNYTMKRYNERKGETRGKRGGKHTIHDINDVDVIGGETQVATCTRRARRT